MKHNVAILLAALSITANAQIYKDKNASPADRAQSIVSEMTLEEKVSLMTNHSAAVPRLGIREYDWWNEALHGVGRNGLATVFPQPIGMAASWDDALVYNVFDIVSTEARAKHNEARRQGPVHIYQGLTYWTPNINIFRDPRWGRGQETYGEDPYLTARMGVSVVKGLQGPSGTKYNKLHACAKHYAVHSGPEWSRHSYDAHDISLRDLSETYLPAFEALVKEAGVKEVMCAYNRFEGEPCCGSNRLLQQILRNEWDYQGIILSDCGAVSDFYVKGRHETEPDRQHASAKAVITGTDLECGDNYPSLVDAVHQGLLNETDVTRSVTRLMKARYELGEMDDEAEVEWSRLPMSVVDCQKHKDVALQMAHESMTLLKNNRNVLPLSRSAKIALVGLNANDSVMQWGNYNGFPSHTSTLLEALRKRLPESQLHYVRACDHVGGNVELDSQVKDADVVIFAGGISPQLEGEEMPVNVTGFRGGDREIIELPEVQRLLVQQLKEMGKPIVMVNYSGSAVALTAVNESCDAILQAWYPGQAGGEAVADVLFGDYNPAGRLPVTFYRSTDNLPDFEDYSMRGRTYRYYAGKPLYVFGHGLSYSTFRYGNATVNTKDIDARHAQVSLTVPVRNISGRDGDEVVEIYLQRIGDEEGPQKALRAFKRVNIPAGEQRFVTFDLQSDQLKWFDTHTNSMRVVPGRYKLLYGSSSDDKQLKSVKITVR